MMRRLLCALVACAAAAGAGFLAIAHPLAPIGVSAAAATLAVWAFTQPIMVMAVLLALLPLIGGMPWTGWLVVEELDIVVLAMASGAYARCVVVKPTSRPGLMVTLMDPQRVVSRPSYWILLVLAPLILSTLISAGRGVLDAGEWIPHWWQGYRESLNSVRLAKPMLGIVLLLPLWLAALRSDEKGAVRSVFWGFWALLAGAALGVWWERLAMPGLLNFSSDYRATGVFWEMHVGGAALDAILVAAFPFCTVAMAGQRSVPRWAGLAVLLTLATYASLVTFSRIVYVALPAAVVLAWWLQARSSAQSPSPAPDGAFRMGAVWLVVNALVVWFLFPLAGYRGLLAWLGVACLSLRLAPRLQGMPRVEWTVGLICGLALAGAAAALSAAWPKGAYWAYAVAWFLAAAAVLRPPDAISRVVGTAAFISCLVAMVATCVEWGGVKALGPSLGIAALTAGVLATMASKQFKPWPDRWGWQAQVVVGMAMTSVVIAVFGGGAYMADRMTTASDDSSTRVVHWKRSLGWLGGGDWVLGKGLGRYLSNYVLSGEMQDQVGDLRLLNGRSSCSDSATANQTVVLTSGKHLMGFGAMFRLSQRVTMPAPGLARLSLRACHQAPVDLVVEICEKHLLYSNNCVVGRLTLPPSEGTWEHKEFELKGKLPLSAGLAFAPRMAVFSIALAQPGSLVELDDLVLRDSAQQTLLTNGDFSQGLARWFTTSDHHHMPWHAKNLYVHLLFEQGLFGLFSFLLVTSVALWRLTVGAARSNHLAPPLAGGLLGLLIVGTVDSLLDMPRVGFVIWFVLAAALTIPARPKDSGDSAEASLPFR